jgi:hypothetical protein
MTTEDGCPETEKEIQERIDEISTDIQTLSMDAEISPAEILVKLVLTMIRECDGTPLTPELEKEALGEFFEAIRQKVAAV